MDALPAKRNRDGAFFGFTRSLCPNCHKVIDAHIVFRDAQVWMQKKCAAHGHFEVVVSSDIDYYVKSLNYTKAGNPALRFATKVEHGCPNDCGLCEDHLQHTCSPIFEINDKCDLTCPICIVRNQQGYSISEATSAGRRSADREGRRAGDDLPVGRRADATPAVLRLRRLHPARAARRAHPPRAGVDARAPAGQRFARSRSASRRAAPTRRCSSIRSGPTSTRSCAASS